MKVFWYLACVRDAVDLVFGTSSVDGAPVEMKSRQLITVTQRSASQSCVCTIHYTSSQHTAASELHCDVIWAHTLDGCFWVFSSTNDK